jgi:hypothetical protein
LLFVNTTVDSRPKVGGTDKNTKKYKKQNFTLIMAKQKYMDNIRKGKSQSPRENKKKEEISGLL